jgi:hypothetical protein
MKQRDQPMAEKISLADISLSFLLHPNFPELFGRNIKLRPEHRRKIRSRREAYFKRNF